MKILAVDPGLLCGWAVLNHENPAAENIHEHFISGVWNLKGDRFEGAGFRFIRLKNYLNEIGKCDLVFYEEVRGHLGVDAAHMYGGIIAHLQAWCEENKTPYRGIPVGTIKKFACGKGNVNKDAMIKAAQEQWPAFKIEDSNEADALFILLYACKHYLK
jgi:Holliday junction resolvasome RuvABC endonuclease subunit